MFHDIQTFFMEWIDYKLFDGKSFGELMDFDSKDGKSVSMGDFYRGFFSLYSIPKSIMTDGSVKDIYKKKLLPVILAKAMLYNELRKISHFSKIEPNLSKVDVLFLTFSNHFHEKSIFRLQPILDGIKSSKSLKHDIIIAENTSNLSWSQGKSFSHFYSYVTEDIMRESRAEANDLAKRCKSLLKGKNLLGELSKLYSKAADYESAFNFFLSEDLFTLSLIYYKTCSRIIKERSVKVVCFTGISSLAERGFITSAYALGIRSMLINHGIIEVIPKSFQKSYDKISIVVVLTEQEKRQLIKKRILQSERIFVSGTVIFDEIVPYVNSRLSKNHNVLIATSPFVEESIFTSLYYDNMMRQIISTILEDRTATITIKLHPRDGISKYMQYQSERVKVIPGNISRRSFYELILACRIFIHFGSTSVYEAMLINRPVITIDPGYDISVFGSEENFRKSSIFLKDFKQLDIAIQACLADERKLLAANKAYVGSNVGIVDGRSGGKLARFLYSLCSAKKER